MAGHAAQRDRCRCVVRCERVSWPVWIIPERIADNVAAAAAAAAAAA